MTRRVAVFLAYVAVVGALCVLLGYRLGLRKARTDLLVVCREGLSQTPATPPAARKNRRVARLGPPDRTLQPLALDAALRGDTAWQTVEDPAGAAEPAPGLRVRAERVSGSLAVTDGLQVQAWACQPGGLDCLLTVNAASEARVGAFVDQLQLEPVRRGELVPEAQVVDRDALPSGDTLFTLQVRVP